MFRVNRISLPIPELRGLRVSDEAVVISTICIIVNSKAMGDSGFWIDSTAVT